MMFSDWCKISRSLEMFTNKQLFYWNR